MAAIHHLTPVSIKHTDTPVQGTSKSKKLTPRQATWLTLSAPDKLTDDQRQKAQRRAQLNPEVAHMLSEAQSFAALLRQQTVALFDSWLQHTRLSTIRELRTFARGIGRDYDAVKAALVLPWTNDLVECHVNRLKFVKRQMFGRAKFDFLRLRVLFHSPT